MRNLFKQLIKNQQTPGRGRFVIKLQGYILNSGTEHNSIQKALYNSLGRLSNDDGVVNENGKKGIGLNWQNNNFARALRFFVHFFDVAARLRRDQMPNFSFCRGSEHYTTTFFSFSRTSIQSLGIQFQK